MYDVYRKTPANAHERADGIWQHFSEQNLRMEQGFFHIMMNIGIVSSGIAILLSAAYLAISARQGPEKLRDAKQRVIKVLVISFLIFSVCGFMNLFQTFGLD